MWLSQTADRCFRSLLLTPKNRRLRDYVAHSRLGRESSVQAATSLTLADRAKTRTESEAAAWDTAVADAAS
jgi:hypothetical protein